MQFSVGGIITLVIILLIPVAILLFKHWRNTGSFKINVKTSRASSRMLLWTRRSEGGIKDIVLEEGTKPTVDLLEWNICGQKLLFGAKLGEGIVPVKPESIVVVSPKKIARIIECMPRRKLNASVRDWYQKLAPFAPVVVIAIGALLLVIMGG